MVMELSRLLFNFLNCDDAFRISIVYDPCNNLKNPKVKNENDNTLIRCSDEVITVNEKLEMGHQERQNAQDGLCII